MRHTAMRYMGIRPVILPMAARMSSQLINAFTGNYLQFVQLTGGGAGLLLLPKGSSSAEHVCGLSLAVVMGKFLLFAA
jgi:hypothetical protein